MPSKPFYKWFPGDYLADTMGLTDDADLLYRRLLDAMWLNGGHLPVDKAELARLARFEKRKFERTYAELRPYLSTENGRIYHVKLREQYDKLKSIQEVRRKAGKAGGIANRVANARANAPQPDSIYQEEPARVQEGAVDKSEICTSSSPESSPEETTREPVEVTTIQEGFAPDDGTREYCRERGYPRPEAFMAEFHRTFKANGKGKTNWQTTLQNYITNSSPAGMYSNNRQWAAALAYEKKARAAETVPLDTLAAAALEQTGLTDAERAQGAENVRGLLDRLG